MPDPSPQEHRQRCLVTGSTGFIGSHLVRHLNAAGWNVHVLMRGGPAPVHSQHAIVGVPIAAVHRYTGSTQDVIEAVQTSKPDVIFHLASLFLAQHTPEQVVPLIEANVLLGTQILEAMKTSGVKSLVNTGTSWQHFHSEGFRPVNLYAATKQAFEDILAYYADAAAIRSVTLDLFDTYGPGDTRRKLLRSLLDCLRTGNPLQMSGGEQVLDLAHVDDICAAYLRAADLVRDNAQPALASYAISGGERMSLRDVVQTLEQVAGRKLQIQWAAKPYREREVMYPWQGADMPGWKPAVTLHEGFQALLREDRPKSTTD